MADHESDLTAEVDDHMSSAEEEFAHRRAVREQRAAELAARMSDGGTPEDKRPV